MRARGGKGGVRMHARVRTYVRACVRACMRACVCGGERERGERGRAEELMLTCLAMASIFAESPMLSAGPSADTEKKKQIPSKSRVPTTCCCAVSCS